MVLCLHLFPVCLMFYWLNNNNPKDLRDETVRGKISGISKIIQKVDSKAN
jgi:hypothetical protein